MPPRPPYMHHHAQHSVGSVVCAAADAGHWAAAVSLFEDQKLHRKETNAAKLIQQKQLAVAAAAAAADAVAPNQDGGDAVDGAEGGSPVDGGAASSGASSDKSAAEDDTVGAPPAPPVRSETLTYLVEAMVRQGQHHHAMRLVKQ